jgi:DNA polymerase-4
VGISSVKIVAKIASTKNKPDGVTEVPPGEEAAFLAPLSIGALWGIGPKTEAFLRARGIATVGDLRERSRQTLESWFGEHGRHLHALAHARDDREVEPGHRRKQVSHEDTYADDVVGRDALCRKLLSQATRVADRLVAKRLRGRRVQLKIRDIDFRTQTRQCTLPRPTQEARTIYDAACRLLDEVDIDGRRFRLTGIGVGNLERIDELAAVQLDLLDTLDPHPPDARGDRLQTVLSAVRDRFGHHALFPAEAGSTPRPGSAGNLTKSLDDD